MMVLTLGMRISTLQVCAYDRPDHASNEGGEGKEEVCMIMMM